MALNILNDREVMINRELGLIQFYRRVLAQVLDEKVPLLERLGYLCIVAKNCDELFEVRVARLLKWEKAQPNKILPDGLKVCDALVQIRAEVCKLFDDMYEIYHKTLVPAFCQQDILILDSRSWTKDQQKWAYNYFINELKPVLTPIGIDPSHPFPRVPNKSLHFAVELEGKDQFGRESKIAIVEAPRILQRVIRLPEELAPTANSFVLLQDIISLHVNEFFYGMRVRGCYPFRVTRAADITVKSDLKNLRHALTAELHNRKYAECSRIELDISRGEPNSKFIDSLLKQFNLNRPDLYCVNGPVNLSRLADITKMVNDDNLRFTPFNPGIPKELQAEPDIFKAMTKGDILLHTPFQSFDPVVELTRQAAEDPNVLAVKMTVYRTGNDSELVQNLIKAARAGKQVVASIELFARFDEEANVELARQLEEAGAHVVYGVMGYKVHAKMLKIVRKEGNQLRHYVHLGTGNYHQTTAKIYTDFGLLTTNPEISRDVDNVFSQITGVGKAGALSVLFQSPFTLHDMVMKAIERETFNALSGKKAAIIAKMNSLVENQVIRALYRASQAGVKITLIIRGACALRPQSPGISDNITVKSVVGRFLEHHRVFYFYDSGNEDVFISSADWMKRNFFKRVETCIPILNPKIKQRVIDESLTLYIQDNVNSWQMDSAGNYTQATLVGKAVSAQDFLMNKLGLPGIKETLANKLIEQAAKLPAVVAEDVLLAKPIRKPRATRSTAKATVESTSAVRKPRVRKTVV
ncbi:MAG: polyphosphate kinase 1 [Burkholderiales bacterium]|nr:polyphosphate kinase 1 [Burkholderiales bacterium]MBP9768997.1 polyphosphate kinase 1 [Burkholderiales bacterium]